MEIFVQLIIVNETLIEYQFSTQISLAVSEKILAIYRYLQDNLAYEALGLINITPTFTTLAISFKTSSPLFKQADYLTAKIQQAHQLPQLNNVTCHRIEVTYNGLDIASLCQRLKLTKKELIQYHSRHTYIIAMLGFKGHFPYLLGLDKKLILPRRASPRTLVKKGSVAIAANQCGIYVEDSPGGWHIIANTNFDNFDCLKAGDKLIFKVIYAH
jgi:KipI family sensor histidine kinase inhibitor